MSGIRRLSNFLTNYNFCYLRNRLALQKRLVSGSLYEPDYINVKPEVPIYETLNISMKSYDFVVLESFTKYVHQIARHLDLDTECYPVPARKCAVQCYKPSSAQIERKYDLAVYERVVQVDNLASTVAPILLEVLQCNMPAGLQMTIKPVDETEEEFRYVPDLTLQELHGQVAELDRLKEDRKKKK